MSNCLSRSAPEIHQPVAGTLSNQQTNKQTVVRPKIHGYTGCKRTGFVKPGSVKLAKGHLLHNEAGP